MRTISAKISDELFEFVQALATENDISISELIKQAIINSKISIGDREKKKFELSRLYALNKIGNNLNQIAKQCNQKRVVDILAMEELIKIREAINGR